VAARRGGSDLAARVAVALIAVPIAIVLVWQGGEVFALGLAVLGVIALGELYTLMARVRPPALAGFLTLVALLAAALYGEPRHVILILMAAFPVTFFLALARPRRANVAWAIAVTMFGVLWIGLPMVHAIWLRDLSIEQNGREIVTGMGLVFDVLIATFVGDTFAYFVGRAYGRSQCSTC
jgi:phosphatidate cytidylyltransferase